MAKNLDPNLARRRERDWEMTLRHPELTAEHPKLIANWSAITFAIPTITSRKIGSRLYLEQ